ncbi:vacuolar protein sorting-associated protein 4B-like isoform X2 [Anneissia japonica]|uniref:vacuolar protein sorting-associated protein 4B-like isoform X2 n=1 Tax=Anneissia japonica TaxID=1529436 RepID=UPI0014256A09|nr:vacuolar protein sorting-associated protein 4B-like isoform X2 [Anneissia japonica]
MSLLDRYKDAVSWLKAAADESEKPNNVNLDQLLYNCDKCSEEVRAIRQHETHPIRKAALEQLSRCLAQNLNKLKMKQHQLRDEQSPYKKRHAATNSCSEEDSSSQSRRLAIQDTIVQKGNVKLQDVAGLKEAKQVLMEAIVMPLLYPHLFTGARQPWRRILLFGPPGTGKSRLAHAISSEINSTFYSVSSADLVSSFVGESERLIKELFQQVVFIDEIDSICRKRTAREEEHTRRIKTELLKQMEGSASGAESAQIFLMCATNCPWELDSAFLRRFQKRVYIPLPDREARISLLKLHSSNQVSLSESDWQIFADKTDGYSGSDISNMVLTALFEPIRDLQRATHWRHTSDGCYIPCSQSTEGASKMKLSAIESHQIKTRDVGLQDLMKAMSSVHKTVTKTELDRFTNFTQQFG